MIRLRRATFADADRLLEWRNDPQTRAMSFDSTPVASEAHRQWMERVLASARELIFIAELNGSPVGTCRLTRDSDVGEAHIAIAAEHRGRELAAPILEALVGEALKLSCVRVIAHVKEQNVPSVSAFRRAGFTEASRDGSVITLERVCQGQ